MNYLFVQLKQRERESTKLKLKAGIVFICGIVAFLSLDLCVIEDRTGVYLGSIQYAYVHVSVVIRQVGAAKNNRKMIIVRSCQSKKSKLLLSLIHLHSSFRC